MSRERNVYRDPYIHGPKGEPRPRGEGSPVIVTDEEGKEHVAVDASFASSLNRFSAHSEGAVPRHLWLMRIQRGSR